MAYYDRGFQPRNNFRGGSWSDPNRGPTGRRYDRYYSGERPWVGGYRAGYQGGSGGYSTQGFRDEWWLGAHYPARYDRDYDRAYRDFDRANRPRYSPVGGTYAAMGGAYSYQRPPRPLREDTWFSDWTRWF